MLSDEIIAFASQIAKTQPVTEQGQAYIDLANEVASCERYVLVRDAVFLVHSVAAMSASQTVAALKICRMPFPKLWVEMIFQDRLDYYKSAGHVTDNNPRSSPPSRLGFFLQQTDDTGRNVNASLIWNHHQQPGPAIAALSINIDLSDNVQISPETLTERRREFGDVMRRFSVPKAFRKARQDASWLEVESRVIAEPCRFMMPFWQHIQRHGHDHITEVFEDAVYDVQSEWRFVIGLLVVLNSRNIVQVSAQRTFEKVNKARLRQHKPGLLSYRNLNLSLSLVQKNRLGAAGIRDLDKHLVAGHFKIRKTGVFWWSPYVRGHQGELVHRTRILKP